MRKTLLLIAAFAPALMAATPVYKFVDKDGVTHYTDRPPAPDAKPANLPPIQTIGAGAAASTPGASGASAPAAPQVKVTITSPAGDETLRGDDRTLPVSCRLDSPMPAGYGLLYLLDGSAQNSSPTSATSYTLTGVERGEHLVAVAVVNGSGQEVSRSAPVIVHMKPPTIANAPTINKPRTGPK